MTLLVRNEADIIDLFVRYHSRIGIDGLIVTDNGSVDGTREILDKHFRAGLITEIIDEPSHVYEQPRFVDRMIRRARDQYGADYCINSDADEFWYCESGSLRHELSRSRMNKIYCPSYHMLPVSGADFWRATYRCIKRADPDIFDIARYYNLFDKPTHKVIHRTRGYMMIEMGNHGVEMDSDINKRSKTIRIYHYSLRSIEQFRRKVIQGGAAIEANVNSTQRQGPHWRYFHHAHMAGNVDFEKEFYKVTGVSQFERLHCAGCIMPDDTMKVQIERLITGLPLRLDVTN